MMAAISSVAAFSERLAAQWACLREKRSLACWSVCSVRRGAVFGATAAVPAHLSHCSALRQCLCDWIGILTESDRVISTGKRRLGGLSSPLDLLHSDVFAAAACRRSERDVLLWVASSPVCVARVSIQSSAAIAPVLVTCAGTLHNRASAALTFAGCCVCGARRQSGLPATSCSLRYGTRSLLCICGALWKSRGCS